jgi:hypothetical protein
MHTGPLALAMFTWILGSESARRKYGKIANTNTSSSKNCGFVNGGDCDLSGDAGSFCQRPAFPAQCD